MIVNWNIESYEGGQGVLHAQVDPDEDLITITDDKEGFVAHIYMSIVTLVKEKLKKILLLLSL